MKIECVICGNGFERKAQNQKYCSKECKLNSRQKVKKCLYCDNKFTGYQRTSYCSMTCASLHNGRSIRKNCQSCGIEFVSKKSNEKYGWGKYCSVECRNKSLVVDIVAECPVCKIKFKKKPSERKIYCSRKCIVYKSSLKIPKNELERLYLNDRKTSREIGIHFNTDKTVILRYLKKYGIPIRASIWGYTKLLTCKDGHKVRSCYERAFDNYLYSCGLEHEYEPRLPCDKRYASDFKVGDVYVEIWGVVNNKKYEQRKKKKKNMYDENNYKLLDVHPNDFKDIKNIVIKLKMLLAS